MFKNFEHFSLLFLNKMLIIRAGIHKMLVTIANREEPDQTASSDLGLRCLSWQATGVRNFKTFILNGCLKN